VQISSSYDDVFICMITVSIRKITCQIYDIVTCTTAIIARLLDDCCGVRTNSDVVDFFLQPRHVNLTGKFGTTIDVEELLSHFVDCIAETWRIN
jgi:hypothetical protein